MNIHIFGWPSKNLIMGNEISELTLEVKTLKNMYVNYLRNGDWNQSKYQYTNYINRKKELEQTIKQIEDARTKRW